MQQLALFTDIPRERVYIKPLDSAAAIHRVLAALPLGGEVPPYIRIYDYQDGGIPFWLVQEREAHDVIQILTLIDRETLRTNVMGEQYARACEVFIAPDRVLAAPIYLWMPGGVKRRDRLADIRQHARQLNERGVEE